NWRDLPKDTPKLEIAVLRYDGHECDKGRMPTKIELTLEQSQQGVSNGVLLMGNQVKGSFEAKEPIIKQFLHKAKEMLEIFYTYTMEHVRRNKKGRCTKQVRLNNLRPSHERIFGGSTSRKINQAKRGLRHHARRREKLDDSNQGVLD
nr:reverse transcriptase domain-containing protein [Tanacetum cinerariifolium]